VNDCLYFPNQPGLENHNRKLTCLWNGHEQFCPYCKNTMFGKAEQIPLRTIEDWFGGGSHYWLLECVICDRTFAYDTYRFVLEACK
jgi:hypothetical protein